MKTSDYLHQSGMTPAQLAEILGHKTTSMVTKKMDVEMPKRWVRMLDSSDTATSAVGSDSESDARTHTNSDDEIKFSDEEFEDLFRKSDEPRMPEDTIPVVGPQRIKLTTVEGYIQQMYGGAAFLARSRGDDIAADVIERYSPEFAEAWINYIQSDPRVMQYLEKMMIGTPLGNLIGVHVIAIGSYVFARAAAREITARFSEQEPNYNGSPDESSSNPLA